MNGPASRLGWISILVVGICLAGTLKGADDIAPLIEKFKKTAGARFDSHYWDNEEKISKQVQAKGAVAVPYLFPLLTDKNKMLREAAARTLGKMDGVTENDLDRLIEAYRAGNHWVCTSIGKIGTQKAADFLTGEMNNLGEYDYAFYDEYAKSIAMTGEKAVPALLKICEGDDSWNSLSDSSDLDLLMQFTFENLGPKAAGAVDPLMKIATDESASWNQREHAIKSVGHIGASAASAVPALKKLYETQSGKDEDKRLGETAFFAIRDTGSKESVTFFLQLLEEKEKSKGAPYYICDIAAAKERGAFAGPALMKYLQGSDWELRVAAARAMGIIGYRESVEELIKLLQTKEDWRVVWCAAASLGMLGDEKALPALQETAKNHWYSPVRSMASHAMKKIRKDPTAGADEDNEEDPYGNFHAWGSVGYDLENLQVDDKKDETKSIKLPLARNQGAILTVKVNDAWGVHDATRRGVKVDGGYLLAHFEMPCDVGPWVQGDLSFFDDHGGSQQIVLQENTGDVFRMGGDIMVITINIGWSSSESCLLKISKGSDGKWIATRWRQLPAWARNSAVLKDGSLFVSGLGGMVRVYPDGTMKQLTRKEVLGK